LAKGVARFSVSVDPDLLEEFDETVNQLGYSRSSAIQRAMRDYLTEQKWRLHPTEEITGAVVMIYEHDARGLGKTLTNIQHSHINTISSTTHVHLDEKNCLEIIAFKGAVKKMQELAKKLMRNRGIKQIKFAALSL